MNPKIAAFLREAEEFGITSEGVALHLRLSLSKLIIGQMKNKGWNQKTLARTAGMKESMLSRILHSDANWQSSTAGALLCALGIFEPELIAPTAEASTANFVTNATPFVRETIVYGQKDSVEQTESSADADSQILVTAETN